MTDFTDPDYYDFDRNLRWVKVNRSEILLRHEIDIPNKNAQAIYQNTLKWIDKENLLGRWKILEAHEPNLIRIKFMGSSRVGRSYYVKFTFMIHDTHVKIEVQNELNGHLVISWWKNDVENYYRYLGVDINGVLLRQFYNKEELEKEIRNTILVALFILVSSYGIYFYLTTQYRWQPENIINVFLFTLPFTLLFIYHIVKTVMKLRNKIHLISSISF